MSKLVEIDTPELKDIHLRSINEEPNWLTGDLKNYPGTHLLPNLQSGKDGSYPPLQQGDLLKPFLTDIMKYGLPYAYAKFSSGCEEGLEKSKRSQTIKPKKVIIIGAGMAGLCAGFELQRAGHQVEILEMLQRVGGRVKTFSEKQGFAKGLHVDGMCTVTMYSTRILWNKVFMFT